MTTRPKIQCTKIFFILFNLIFWLTGLALLVIGIWSRISLVKYMKLSTSIDYNLAPYIMIGCGAFIILVGILGCWAALREHSWALILMEEALTVGPLMLFKFSGLGLSPVLAVICYWVVEYFFNYMIILVILFIAELAAGIGGYILRNKLRKGLEDGMKNAMNKYGNDTKGETRKAIDDIQGKVFHCCGADSYLDWTNGTMPNWKKNTVPKSCCRKEKGCHYNSVIGNEKDIYTEGCVGAMKVFFKDKFAIIGGTALGIAFFQLLGIICAYLLARFIRVVSSYQEF